MKKSIISIALVISFATSLFAFEWGGMIDNATSFSTSDFKKESMTLNQSNGAYLNISSFLTKDKSLRIASEVMYKYTLSITEKDKDFKNIIDLNLLKLAGDWNLNGNLLSLNAGRFIYSDKTGNVFSQKSDGVNITFKTRSWNLGFYGGYTGLLNRYTVMMPDNLFLETKSKQFYDLSYSYIPLMLDFTFTNVARNIIGLQASYFLDVTKNKNHKAYGTVTVKGPLGRIGSYYVAGTVGTAKFKDIMARGTLNLSFMPSSNFIVAVGADYASGYNKIFVPFNSITAKSIHWSVAGVDAIVPKLTATYAANNLAASVTEKLVMTIPDSFELNGIDNNLSIVYNLFSDLQLSTSVSAYIDFKHKENNKYNFGINANFVF